ncbi:SusD/RagB family nutrient-binding outer membrane lipoprotein [Pedobacter sp. PAMC26386]|nr:SusD/RagB family nutrient-binding outer membrane lipoprotein [Pedobacter sp. PAMC26386]
MKILKYILCLPVLAVIINGCQKYEEINTNPNVTTQVNSPLLATTLILNITRNAVGTQKSFMQPFLLGKYLTWGENQVSYQYNKLGSSDFDSVKVLRNIPPMIKYATSDNLRKSYEGLGHFMSAWQFYLNTMQVGDMPYSEANKGESDRILQPKYDTQKAVFLGILKELDQANDLFAAGADFAGDPIYGGKVDNWRRLTNSFELHVLLNLYKKTGDADLKVIERFKDIAANRPLMRSYADNFALAYTAMAGQNYPWSDIPAGSGNAFVKSNYTMLSGVLLNPLKAMKDKRLFYFAKPSPVKIKAGANQSDYDAYVGVEPSDAFTALQKIRGTTDYSDLNNRYVQLVNAEPVSVFSYWDLQFALSEATVRGWIGGTSAQAYYAAGITNSMKFIAAYTPDLADYHHNMKMEDAYINAYPTSEGVALSGSSEQQIAQIITQKYLANFLQGSQYLSWFENRRTGYPVFKLNTSTSLNIPSSNFPVRWFYPSAELNYNSANVTAAIASQYNGSDDNNQLMWILK